VREHTSKTHLDVSGKMTASDAGKVGTTLANAAKWFAILSGCSGLVLAFGKALSWLRWW